MGQLESTFVPTVGETYKVSWDGTTYESTCVNFNSFQVIGNLSIGGLGSDTGEPFVIVVTNGKRIDIATADTSASHTISISELVTKVVKIDEKYLPDTVATNWRQVVQEISYNKTEGYFFVNAFDTTALKREDMPYDVFCANVYVGNKIAMAFLSKSYTVGNSWFVTGFAVITDEYSQTGEVLYVSSNTISQNEAKGLFLTFRAPDSMLLKSSTANSTKKFRITVDDSGALTTTEVT